MRNYEVIFNAMKFYEEAKKENQGRTPANVMDPYPKGLTFINDLTKDLSSLELKLNDNGKVSTMKTIKHASENAKKAVGLAYEFPRAKLMGFPTKKAPKYCALTPLFMYAHKEYNSIPYEDWDKEDSGMLYALGKGLEDLVRPGFIGVDWEPLYELLEDVDAVKDLREQFLGPRKSTDYVTRKAYFAGYDLYGNIARIVTQTWMANEQYRVPGAMILDLRNWDNTPEAFDASTETVEERWEKKAEMEAPW